MVSDSILSRFLKGAFSVGLGNISTMALGLLGVMIVTRRLPAEEFGIFVLIQVVVAFLARVSSFGFGLAVPKFITGAKSEDEKRQLVNTAVYFRILTIPLVCLLALLLKPALSQLFEAPQLADFFVFVAVFFFFDSLAILFKAIFQGFFLFKKIALTEFISSCLNFILIIVFVLLLKQGILGLLLAKIISLSVACLYAYLALPVAKRIEFRLELLRPVLKFGFPLQLNDVLSFVYLRIDTLMLGAMLGPKAIAYYEVARRIPDSLTGLYEAFRAVFFPFIAKFFAHGERQKAAQMLNHSTRLISFATMLGTLVVLVFGREIISLLFSAQYLASVPAFVLLMIWLNLAFTDSTLGYSLVAAGDSNKPAMINVLHAGVNVVGNLLLIPPLGIAGAALSSVLGFAATNPVYVYFLRRRNVDARVMAYLKPMLIFAAIWLLVFVLQPALFVAKASVVVLFIVTSAVLSVITLEDLNAVAHEAKVTLPGSRT
jgi:O-antigen/teichoic acid export membrane protein